MPADHRLGLHDHQGRAPIPPGLGGQDPKQPIGCAERRPPDRAPEHGQLLTERQVLDYDGAVSAAEQRHRAEHHDERGQHALS